MSHYFSRIALTPEGVDYKIRMMSHHSYDLHKEMWNLFPGEPDADRSFLYSIMDDGKTVLMVSEREPVFNNYWSVESKSYDPVISEGDSFRFRICANPTVANSISGKHQRHDVVMNLKRKLREEGVELSQNEIVQRAVTEWMVRKAGLNGFSVDENSLLIHSYEKNETFKQQNGKKIVFSTATIEGSLTVKDKDKFRKALFCGIGSAKGFGCGMLMIRRI